MHKNTKKTREQIVISTISAFVAAVAEAVEKLTQLELEADFRLAAHEIGHKVALARIELAKARIPVELAAIDFSTKMVEELCGLSRPLAEAAADGLREMWASKAEVVRLTPASAAEAAAVVRRNGELEQQRS
jgi:hypothetical protein